MVVALLVLIVFILLFGAGVVRGLLMNAVGLVCGFIVLIGLLGWVGSFFGEDGFIYAIFGFFGLVFILGMWAKMDDEGVADTRMELQTTYPGRSDVPVRRVANAPVTTDVDGVWAKHLPAIKYEFGLPAQRAAREFYKAKDAAGLDAFCRREISAIEAQHVD